VGPDNLWAEQVREWQEPDKWPPKQWLLMHQVLLFKHYYQIWQEWRLLLEE
jgi:hypothetical protein